MHNTTKLIIKYQELSWPCIFQLELHLLNALFFSFSFRCFQEIVYNIVLVLLLMHEVGLTMFDQATAAMQSARKSEAEI